MFTSLIPFLSDTYFMYESYFIVSTVSLCPDSDFDTKRLG